MRLVALIIVLMIIALGLAIAWYVFAYRVRVDRRREAELNRLKRILRKIDVALDKVVAVDPLERQLVDNIRGALLDYYGVDGSMNRVLKAAHAARRRITLELDIQRNWILINSASDEIQLFYREASEALRDNEKEVPA